MDDPSVSPKVQLELEALGASSALESAPREPDPAHVFQAILDGIPAPIFYKDAEGVYRGCNRAFVEYLGRSREEIIGMTVYDVAPRALAETYDAADRALLASRGVQVYESAVRYADGSIRDVVFHKGVYLNEDGEVGGQVGTILDVTARKRAEKAQRESEARLEYQALFDGLTGLPNRVLFERRLQEALASASADAGFALLFIDLDRFKSVNDTLGHGAGDALLQQVTARLAEHMRAGDTLARMGGDEFTCILGGVRDVEAAARVAERVLDACRAPFDIDGHEIFIGASVGVSLWPLHGEDASVLLRGADSAMYRAKTSGKDRYRVYSSDMASAAAEALTLEAALHRALERDELVLHYQPKLDAVTHRLIGFEALVRWNHPRRGLLQPGVFIPVAEKSGLIVRLGAWVLRRACEQTAAWRRAGLAPPPMAINVSARQFDDGAFIDHVAGILRELDLPADHLEIELTEGVIMRNVAESSHQLARLRVLGVRIAVDDFGTGYSSLSYLQRLPIDLLKIDRSFVKDMDARPSTLPLVHAIIELAHSLGLQVIAEGVETQEQLESLQRLTCDQIQGFLLGVPVTAEEAAARWLTAG
jgi:diguanylate cyclase (GGDEF)-like protein/PAS domain S-box-containing protein